MSEILPVIMNLSVLVFVITSMLAMGLSLTAKSIIGPTRGMPGLVKVACKDVCSGNHRIGG